MAKGSRRRREPAYEAGVTHNIGTLTGLGPSSDRDAEQVAIIGDRCQFGTAERLFTSQGTTQAKSAWVSCEDSSQVRIKIEYKQSTGTRRFVVGLRGHNGNDVWWSEEIEPDNLALNDDVLVAGNYNAHGFYPINCLGMKEFCLLVLAGSGGDPAIDAWGCAS